MTDTPQFPDAAAPAFAPAVAAPELTRLLAPHAGGYLGADGCLSVPLPDGRTAWFMGDTLVGEVAGGSRTVQAMTRNSLAIQAPGAPAPEKMRVVFAAPDGTPRTYIRFPDMDEKQYWYWPGTAFHRNGCIHVFGYRVEPAKGNCEALSFRVVDPWLARVYVDAGEPEGWRIRLLPLPWRVPGGLLSTACFERDGFLHLLGVSWTGEPGIAKPTRGVMGRLPVEALDAEGAPDSVEFLCSDDGADPRWTPGDTGHLHTLFEPGTTEATIYFDEPRGRFLATTYRGTEPGLYVTTAPQIGGPWSKPARVFTATEGHPRERFLFYCLRMHPHLARDADEIVLSYIVNSRGWDDLVAGLDIYYPHFLRLDLRSFQP